MVRKQNGRSEHRLARPARREMERRRAILRAAAHAFRRRGFAATGMRDIAEAADLSAANLYYYFKSKDDLLFFCQDHSLDRLLQSCRTASRRRSRAPERLADVLRSHLGCLLDELDGAAAHLELDALPPARRKALVAKRDRYEQAVRRLIETGVAEGSFAACDPALVTRAILGALNWTARWFDPSGPVTAPQVADQFTRYLVRGLMP